MLTAIEQVLALGLAILTPARFSLTERGILLQNSVLMLFMRE